MRLAILMCVAACGSPDPNRVDAPKAIDAAIDAKDIDAARPLQGQVVLSESTITGQAPSSNVSTTFADGSPMGMVLGTDGPCSSLAVSGGPVGHSAGVITVTGTTVGLTLTPSTGTVHYTTTPTPPPADLFAVHATLHFAGAGSPDFGAFAGDVVVPTTVAGFTPPTTMSKQGHTLTWTADSSVTVMQIVLFATSGSVGLVFCRVPDNGSFTIPASTFALFPAGATGGGVLLARTNETVLTSASGTVALQAVEATGSMGVTFTP
jgi:hypothetical protein